MKGSSSGIISDKVHFIKINPPIFFLNIYVLLVIQTHPGLSPTVFLGYLRTSGPVPFETCIWSIVQISLSEIFRIFQNLNFQHPSVLLFSLRKLHVPRQEVMFTKIL